MHHALAKVTAPDAIAAITEGVAQSTLLIADGHHRYETALRYSEEVSLRAPGRGRARRAPLLHDVPRERRRSEPRRLPDAPARPLARRRSPSRSCSRAPRRGSPSTPLPQGVDASAALAALAAAGKTGPSVVAAAPRRPRRPADAPARRRRRASSDARPARPHVLREDGRGRPALGDPRARPRHHARGPGRQDEHLVPAGRARGAGASCAPARGRCSSS